MKTYARIDAGVVAELLQTPTNPADLFHPSLRWVEVQDPAVTIGWIETTGGFLPPREPEPPAVPTVPSLAELHARLTELAEQVAALKAR